MPTKTKLQRKAIPDFVGTVREALTLLNKPSELGKKSPLAAPYFLGDKLELPDSTPEDRGQVLSDLLTEIIEEDITDPLYHQILMRRYFDGMPAQTIQEETGFGRARFNDHQGQAVAAVGSYLIQRVRRILHLEKPPIPPPLYERGKFSEPILEHLNTAFKSVIITGNSGIGKTAIGSQIAKQWQHKNGPVFWYTICPGLTDQFSVLSFSLAYFLDQHGQSSPWLDLVTKEGTIQPGFILGLIRAAIAKLAQKPLLCFDELDLLDSTQRGQSQILEFINALHETVSILLLSQQARLDADHIERLDGFSLIAVDEFCRDSGIYLKSEQLSQLQTDTQGNPRFLNLFVALYQTGEDIQTILDYLHKSPSVEHLLNRVLIRLDETERQVLMQLAVFRGSAPSYIWQQNARTAVALQKLLHRHLVRDDQDGLVSLLLTDRVGVLKDLKPEQKIQLHRQAADARSQLAQYTEAMYHLTEAQQPDIAIQLWNKYGQQEIQRGQSGVALTILEKLKDYDLSDNASKKLYDSYANLKRLHGDPDQVLQNLQVNLQSTPVLEIEELELEGYIENNREDYSQREGDFGKFLTYDERFIEGRLAFIHSGLGWGYIREWDLEKAMREADLAAYEAENFRGDVLEVQCLYQEAEAAYRSALTQAEKLEYTQGIAKTSNNLARLHGFLGQFESAKQYQRRAQYAYQQAGEFMGVTGSNINLALIYTLSSEYLLALEILDDVEKQWQRIGLTIQTWQQALIELMRADAYVGLEDWDVAAKSLDYVFENEDPTNMPDALRIRGEVLAGQGDYEAAKISIQQSIDLAKQSAIPYLEAYAWRAMGKIHMATNNVAEAKSSFEQAIQLFSQIELQHEVEKTEQLFQD